MPSATDKPIAPRTNRESLGLNYAMRLSALTLQMKCPAQEVATLLAARGDAISSTSEARPTGAPGTSG